MTNWFDLTHDDERGVAVFMGRVAALPTGAVPDPMTPEEYATFIRTEIATFREVARAANVRLEG